MRNTALIIIASAILSIGCSSRKEIKNPTTSTEEFLIRRGLNASHWLSQSQKRGAEREAYMSEKDFARMA
jgi:hypothetical protein